VRNRPQQITGEIFQVGGAGLTAGDDAAVYLVRFGNIGALIDAGCGRSVDAILENIRFLGMDPAAVETVLLTHCHFDHTGGAAELRNRLGARVVAHERDAGFLESGDSRVTAADWYGRPMAPVTVDRKLTGEKETIALGKREIAALHVPGHSPGSVVYLTESEGLRVLFGQDVHGPLHPDLLSNGADYRRSLKRMLALGPDILCEGHYGVIHGKAAAEAFIQSFL
jgi:glyoxylase-like metal-dependent hydrolase (beta-lactamase superfamily II)